MKLTHDEITIILNALQKEYGVGYSGAEGVAQLQAKLSLMLQVSFVRDQQAAPSD